MATNALLMLPYCCFKQAKSDVIFDMSKRCSHTPKSGYKKLYRKLRSSYSMGVNKDEIAADVICNAKCLVFGNPRQVLRRERRLILHIAHMLRFLAGIFSSRVRCTEAIRRRRWIDALPFP